MNLNTALTQLARDADAPLDLAEIALLLARDEYPDLDVDGYLSELNAMAVEVQRSLHGGFATRVECLCRYLYRDLGFIGNANNYYDPRNSYLNEVIDRRTGLPIALSAVAIAVGQRAGLNVVGVGLPGHFIAKATAGEQEVLFDPFHGGKVLSIEECGELIREATGDDVEVTAEDLRPASLASIVGRMLTNLKGTYLSEGDFARAVTVLRRLRQLQPDEPTQQRDLGVALVQAGRPGQAIEELEAFLETSPNSKDDAAVRALLRRAKSDVAKWN
jgi:regulator of sirC expression with transglutaminase-like and TPR domain